VKTLTTVVVLGGTSFSSRQMTLMKSKSISLTAIAGSLFAVFSAGPIAKAQTTIDAEKITCRQFVTVDVADPNQIGIWPSGYFHGNIEIKSCMFRNFVRT
jgi:hypothetical protein